MPAIMAAMQQDRDMLAIGCRRTLAALAAATAVMLSCATASAQVKPATCETGLVVTVPSFVNVDEKIRVNTETGEYMSRV